MLKKKLTAVILTVVTTVTMLSGCSQKKANDQSAANEPAKKVPIKIVTSEATFPGITDQNISTKVKELINKELNVDLELVTVPHNTYSDKIKLMLSSNEQMDAFLVQAATNSVPIFANQGKLKAVDEYQKLSKNQYGDSFKPFELKGKTYAIGSSKPTAQVLWFRKDILDKNGVKLPTTTDEFYTEMSKLKGKVIPLTFPKWVGNFQYFLNSFGGFTGLAIDKNGKVYDGFVTDETKQGLTYLKKLYAEGILDKEFITNENSTMREKYQGGKAASSVYWEYYYGSYQADSKKVDPNADSVAVPLLKGPNGKGGALNAGVTDAYALSVNAKEPKKAVEFIEWLYYTNAGYKLRSFGVEGVTYTNTNGDITFNELGQTLKLGVNISGYINSLSNEKLDFKFPADVAPYLEKGAQIKSDTMKNLGPLYVIPAGKSDTYDKRVVPEYSKKVEELMTKVIMGSLTLDDAYKQYATFWKSIDGDKALEELNK